MNYYVDSISFDGCGNCKYSKDEGDGDYTCTKDGMLKSFDMICDQYDEQED